MQMFNGTQYLWPNVSLYVVSYLYQFDKNIDQNAYFRVEFILVLLCLTGVQVGPYLANVRQWNHRVIMLLGCSLTITGVVLSSFQTSLSLFVLFYGVFSGLGCGTCFIVPFLCCWESFPERKGLMTGLMVSAYGIGSLAFTQIATAIVNPQGLTPQKDIGIQDYLLFDADVADNIPRTLRTLAGIYAVQCLIAIILMSRPEKEQHDHAKDQDSSTDIESKNDVTESSTDACANFDPNTKEVLREFDLVSATACFHSVRFWQYFSFYVFADLFSIFFMGQFKPLGLAHGYSDRTLSMAASFTDRKSVV